MLSSKLRNNKASDIKLVYLYSTILVVFAEMQWEDVLTCVYLNMMVILLSNLKLEKDFVHVMTRQV